MTMVLSNAFEAKEEELDPKAESFTQMMANAVSHSQASKTPTEDKTQTNTNSEPATTNKKLAIATTTDTRSTTTSTADCGSAQKSSSRTAVARIKQLKPSRFPIRKLPHMSFFPPGLNLSTLLDSPILQSSNEAEPSPTTGTSPLHPIVQGIGSPGAALSQTGGAALGLASATVTASEKSSLVQEGGSPTILYKPVPSFSRQAISAIPAIPLSENPALPSGTLKAFPLAAAPSPKTPTSNKCKALVPVGATENVNDISSIRTDQLQLSLQSTTHIDMPSEDGYNWRKYGQKSVKNTGFTRSYYRCAHANCPAKKIVEQTHVVIKGEHDHPKPQAIRRMSTGASPAVNKSSRDSMGGILKGDSEHVADVLPMKGQIPNCESATTQTSEPSSSSTDGDEGVETIRSKHDEVEGAVRVRDDEGCDDEHDSKNRKKQKSGDGAAKLSLRSIREPRFVVQTTCEGDTVDDGYRWCKYGQKLIKGKTHPRSYYKCHSPGCPVRKHVERSSTDAKTVISTYEGTHNHEMPASRTNGHSIAAPILTSINLSPLPDTASTMSNAKSALLQSPFSKGRSFHDMVNGQPNLSLQQPGVMGGRQLEERGEDRPISSSDIAMPQALAVALPGTERAIPTSVNFLKPSLDGRSAFQRAESLALRPKAEPDDGRSESALQNKAMAVTVPSDSKPDKTV